MFRNPLINTGEIARVSFVLISLWFILCSGRAQVFVDLNATGPGQDGNTWSTAWTTVDGILLDWTSEINQVNYEYNIICDQ